MKIYTKSGDKGKTSLIGGVRVAKNHLRIETYGTIDELNAHIGLLRDNIQDEDTNEVLLKIQNELFTVGAQLATAPEKELLRSGKKRLNLHTISDSSIGFLEDEIDKMNENLQKMTHFILPGGHSVVSFCHIARCICRRGERLVVSLNDTSTVDPILIQYLNRLSDFLFVLARKLSNDLKIEEIKWIPQKKK